MKHAKKMLFCSTGLLMLFVLWTILIQSVDVEPVGVNGTNIGFSSFNLRFHNLTGVHMALYNITDWLGLVPMGVCFAFGAAGFVQLVKRRSILKVDADFLILGIYYVLVIFSYLIFEEIPINYRPVLIDSRMEVSYPSSTTLLVLSVMPTLSEQIVRRVKSIAVIRVTEAFVYVFSAFMVIGRLLSGVHWVTDIVGSVLLSSGLFCAYKGAVLITENHKC